MIPPYLTILRTQDLEAPLFLNVQTDAPQQAAEVASEHWLRDQCDLKLGAELVVEVHQYHSDGSVNPTILFSLDQKVLKRKQGEWVKRASKLQEYSNAIEDCRRATQERMEKHLSNGRIAVADLDVLRAEFENGHNEHSRLQATVLPDGPPSLHGTSTLAFRELATRATRAVGLSGSGGSWEHWLEVLVGYLLENDDRGEFITKRENSSRSRIGKEKIFETYLINRVFKASALCCSRLRAKVLVHGIVSTDEPGAATLVDRLKLGTEPKKSTSVNPPDRAETQDPLVTDGAAGAEATRSEVTTNRCDFSSKAGRNTALAAYTKDWKCSEAALARTARAHPADLSKWKKGSLPANSDKKTRIENALNNNAPPTLSKGRLSDG